jgi:hypothetical protein
VNNVSNTQFLQKEGRGKKAEGRRKRKKEEGKTLNV